MYINQENEQNVEPISLKSLIMILWKHKIIIISVTFIVTVIAGIYSLFILSPVYNSKLNIIISMPTTLTTQFGDYTLPFTTNQQYIQLITNNDVLANTIKDMGYDPDEITLDDLKPRISLGTINMNVAQNNFNVTVSADNPKEAKQLADTLFANYTEYLDAMTTERAVLYYYDTYSVKIKTLESTVNSNKELMNKNEELLKSIPETINMKDALAATDSKVDITDFIVLENIINPNYTKVEGDIILLKQTIYNDENTISNYESYLKELDNEKNIIAKYYESGKEIAFESSINDAIYNNTYLSSSPLEPTEKTSPSNTRNVLIGAVFGGMIGVLIVLFKEYWFTKK